jgi:hypothetical protein
MILQLLRVPTSGFGSTIAQGMAFGTGSKREREQQRHREVPVLRGHAGRVPALVAGGDGAMVDQRGWNGREGNGAAGLNFAELNQMWLGGGQLLDRWIPNVERIG